MKGSTSFKPRLSFGSVGPNLEWSVWSQANQVTKVFDWIFNLGKRAHPSNVVCNVEQQCFFQHASFLKWGLIFYLGRCSYPWLQVRKNTCFMIVMLNTSPVKLFRPLIVVTLCVYSQGFWDLANPNNFMDCKILEEIWNSSSNHTRIKGPFYPKSHRPETTNRNRICKVFDPKIHRLKTWIQELKPSIPSSHCTNEFNPTTQACNSSFMILFNCLPIALMMWWLHWINKSWYKVVSDIMAWNVFWILWELTTHLIAKQFKLEDFQRILFKLIYNLK